MVNTRRRWLFVPNPIDESRRPDILDELRGASMEVIKGKGGTVFGPAYHIVSLIRMLLADTRDTVPCSAVLDGEYGISECSLGVRSGSGMPVSMISSNGISMLGKMQEWHRPGHLSGISAARWCHKIMPAQVMRSSETLTVPRTYGESGALTIAINQVEYSNTPEGPIIHVFGRDPGGLAHRIDVTGFLPYFYVPEEQVGQAYPPQVTIEPDTIYRSIRGEKLKRLYTVRPGDVREVRERYRDFEADIPFATRFMIDCGLTGAVSVPATTVDYHALVPAEVDAPARVCMIDIECEDERGFPDTQRDAIICITCHDSFDNDYTTFLFGGGTMPAEISKKESAGGLVNGCFRKGTHTICTYADEVSMLKAFGAYIAERDPDILSGWNFVEFDMPYIMGRMEKLGLSPVMLARLPGMTERNALRGRALFDLLTGDKKMHSTLKESYRLDAVAGEEVGERKVRYTGTVSDLWKKQPALLVEYNYKDVETLCCDQQEGQYRRILPRRSPATSAAPWTRR